MRGEVDSGELTTATSDRSTADLDPGEQERPPAQQLALTVIYHPDPGFIGRSVYWDLRSGGVLELSRAAPLFTSPAGEAAQALGDAHISRTPLRIHRTPSHLVLTPDSDRVTFELGGRPGASREEIPLHMLSSGVILTLGRRVSLALHTPPAESRGCAVPAIVGVSAGLARLREEIRRLAPLDVCVLITGESGTGKELVAQSLHQLSPRSQRRLIAVNMAALPGTTAISQLFGHARGAFTGAAEARGGLFTDASGGTLFLDEVGAMAAEIQPMLLRAIESREIQPVGQSPRPVDTRIIAATDTELDRAVAEGRFSRPLFYRLAAASVHMPALRDHRIDVPLLLLHFLREALLDLKADHLLSPRPEGSPPWLRRRDVMALLRYHWPGNVRELRNVAWQMAVEFHDQPTAQLPSRLAAVLEERDDPLRDERPPSPPMKPTAPPISRVRPSEIDAGLLLASLEACDWRIGASAERLGISRNSLYVLMEQYGVRHAGLLTLSEIEAAAGEIGTRELEPLARVLRVSPRGLRLRLRALGLEP